MAFKNKIPQWLQSDWLYALLLFIAFLSAKGYKYGWDDQHLEIPLKLVPYSNIILQSMD